MSGASASRFFYRMVLQALIALFVVPCASEEGGLRVPEGKAVMIDGQISPGEWDDARKLPLNGGARLLVKRHEDYLLVGVELSPGASGFVDLFLSPESRQILDFHASAKLGERSLENGSWPEWSWWNNRLWVANVSRVDSFDQRRFLPDHAREFQIQLSRFGSKRLLLRLMLSLASQSGYKGEIFPIGTSDKNTKGWVELDL